MPLNNSNVQTDDDMPFRGKRKLSRAEKEARKPIQLDSDVKAEFDRFLSHLQFLHQYPFMSYSDAAKALLEFWRDNKAQWEDYERLKMQQIVKEIEEENEIEEKS